MSRSIFIALVLLLSAACNADLCKSARSKIHDPELYAKLVQSLEEHGLEFNAIENNTICYEAENHDRITAEIIRIRSITHPIRSRIDVARGMDEEVFEALNKAGVRYEWFIEKDRLVLIVNPDDFDQADAALGKLFEKLFPGRTDAIEQKER